MTKLQRIKEIIFSLVMLLIAFGLLLEPVNGYPAVISVISFWLIIKGLGTLWYYITMARHMVGGRMSLFTGMILFDFGMFTLTLTDIPHYYIVMYLIAIHAFSGLVEVLRAFEAKRGGASSWRFKMSHGLVDIALAVLCIVCISRLSVTVVIYSIGLIYSSLMRIVSACRRTRFIYIR
ncbi:MAG: DUF308 domain-containing protein [Lachnospiraceae bacterium]|nr:DUF308 domain-containing protein [Lachnospiraceae bacterium]